MTQVIELVDKNMKVIKTILHMFKKVEKNMSMLNNYRKNRKDPNQISKVENYNVWDGKCT